MPSSLATARLQMLHISRVLSQPAIPAEERERLLDMRRRVAWELLDLSAHEVAAPQD